MRDQFKQFFGDNLSQKPFPLPEEINSTPTEFVHIAGKSQVKQVLQIMEEFYSGGELMSMKQRRNTINLKKLSKAPMNTVDRLTGGGGKIYDLE